MRSDRWPRSAFILINPDLTIVAIALPRSNVTIAIEYQLLNHHHFSQKTPLSTKENNHEAVVLEEQGVINVREVPDVPAPGLGELKIAPHTVGVCGSDLHYYTHGRVGKYVVEQPMILGHEASGTVVEVGPGVEGFKVGDRVAMEPGIPDMSSRASKLGMYNVDPAVRFFATPPIDAACAKR